MKVEISRITSDGISIEDSLDAEELDLNTSEVKFVSPLKVNANIFKIKNVVSVELEIESCFHTSCSRCLKEIQLPLKRHLRLNYQVMNNQQFIELDEDIREDIILSYSLRYLCSPDCLGLCPKCGKNLNEGKCNCI
jgi:uncharacterized protein